MTIPPDIMTKADKVLGDLTFSDWTCEIDGAFYDDALAIVSAALMTERQAIRDEVLNYNEHGECIEDLALLNGGKTFRELRLEQAIQVMIYETTHLSPREDDGSHKCKISAAALEDARNSLKSSLITPKETA